ncbi:uncharacterized protein RCC_04011 [Ramularia collo-cygni]|uniref:Ubiquitin 3 binding protein But2 C-terminal domain-containing protein n=1 Tax=Ramularia collo-cygni TaxID=112498 RepID=A0A2D3UQR9_9PEZI|nr:uncharacterized protein RCC_04011 [Ramularia collo-cygni]CZT18171.1 uncharacterized protein RCC_04011 [Ramularia collo-cygni]
MHFTTFLALVSGAAAQFRGFNYGSKDLDGSPRTLQDFEDQFNAAKRLPGQEGVFTSARLFTMIQDGTSGDLISAIQAAVNTDTNLLLGLWGSAGQEAFNLELAALRYAIQQYPDLGSRVAGISVGSEDLYRNSPTGIENMSGRGASPEEIANFIGQVRQTIAGTGLSGVSVGHVDTWTAYVNASNNAVIEAADWLGVDAYPYFQTTQANGIENGESLFFAAYEATVNVAQGKPVWITETGWPVAGPQSGVATASTDNARTYWRDVACRVLGTDTNLWWFTLDDDQATSSDVSFSLVNPSDLFGTPFYDLSCPGSAAPSSTSSASASVTSSAVNSASSTSSTSATATSGAVSSASSAVSSAASYVSSALSSAAPSTSTVVSASVSAITPSTLSTVIGTPTKKPACPSPTKPAETPSDKHCPTNLSGAYEYPHLIVPVDSANPTTAKGTSYFGTVSPTVSSVFNFDIKPEDAGKTCSIVFLFPKQEDLETSSFTFNGKGGMKVTSLAGPATEQTTYDTVPAAGQVYGTVSNVAPGNEYHIASIACPAGQRIGVEISSTDGLDLHYFQDYNPSPIGAYITVC